MPPLPIVGTREVCAALAKAGFSERPSKRGHVILVRLNPPPAITISVPVRRELMRGTLRAIIRDAGLTVEQFVELLR